MHKTTRSTRSSTRTRTKNQEESVLRKIREMSPTKKTKLSRVITKYKNTRKKLKNKHLQEEKELKKLKRKVGRFMKTFKDLTHHKKLPRHLAVDILTTVKDMEKYEKQVKDQLEKSNKEKDKLDKSLLQLQTQISNSEDLLFLYSSPNERRKRMSPELLEGLTQDRLDLEIQEEQKLRRQYKTKEDKAIEALEKLNTKISALAEKLKSLA